MILIVRSFRHYIESSLPFLSGFFLPVLFFLFIFMMMFETNDDDDDDGKEIFSILNDLVDQVIVQLSAENISEFCEDCAVTNETVEYDIRIRKTLCSDCVRKRDEEREKVLEDLQNLANEVEQRLEAIENTERELDQWRDAQLQKNRYFWDGKMH